MSFRAVILAVFLLVVSSLAAALDRGCSQGVGEYQENLWDGYVVEIGPAQADAAASQCRAAVKAADGKVIFETGGPEALLHPITGRDVNADGKSDVVIETHRAGGRCCYTYSIVTPGENPALVRQITTTPPLNFEDREGDGKIELSTRDFAFLGIDGLPDEESPQPLVIFRLKGSTLFNVSGAYWPDYEREIEQIKANVPKAALELLTSAQQSDHQGRPKELSSAQERQVKEGKAAVLNMVLDYLYGGKGEEAWKTVREMWPDRDKERIRQLILQDRSRGVLSEVNRPPAATPSNLH